MALRPFRFAKNRLRKVALNEPCKTVLRPLLGAVIGINRGGSGDRPLSFVRHLWQIGQAFLFHA
jgi:hypothetical protein